MNKANDAGYPVENVLLSGFAYIQLFGQPLKRERRYLFVECKKRSFLLAPQMTYHYYWRC